MENTIGVEKHIVYILECINNSFYTGYTTDLTRRYAEHSQGSPKCKYTRSFPPKRIAIAWEISGDKSMALKIERKIKQFPANIKRELILSEGNMDLLTPWKGNMILIEKNAIDS